MKKRAGAERARARRRVLTRTVTVSGCASVAVLGGLSLQMASGKDPVLGPEARQAALKKHPRVDRRIIKRKIIVRKIQPPPEVVNSGSAPASVGSSAAAPSYSAPAPTYSAPAPAPAPAPVTSGGS